MSWHHEAYCDWAPIQPHPDVVAKCECGHERAQHEVQRGASGGARLHCMDRQCECLAYREVTHDA